MTRRCEYCGTLHPKRKRCPSCDLYNAAVTAINAAAQEIARNFHPKAKDAWLNEYGVFADINGRKVQVGTPEEAKPFDALTSESRRVKAFWPRTTHPLPRKDKHGS